MTQYIKIALIFLCLLFIIVLLSFYITKNTEQHPIKAECTNIGETIKTIEIEKEIINWEGWKCEKIQSSYFDLRQPTGVWGNIKLNCWKLEQTIEDYCKENPTHCNN